jgi:hypothetical protein
MPPCRERGEKKIQEWRGEKRGERRRELVPADGEPTECCRAKRQKN